MTKENREGIHLFQSYYLVFDERNMVIRRYTNTFVEEGKNKGRENFVVLGYFAGIEQVAKRCYDLKIRGTAAKNLKELVDDHRRVVEEIRELFELKGLTK